MKIYLKNILLLTLLTLRALPLGLHAQAASVTLGWGASPAPDVGGYKIYFGQASQSYSNSIVVGNKTTVTVTGLTYGVPYYFAATTYDTNGLEGPFSNEAQWTVTNTPPTLALPPNATVLNFSNATPVSIALTGISAGLETNQPVTVTATTSNTNLVRNLTVNYVSPQATGVLTFTVNTGGIATNTVTVSDGVTTVSRSFVVTIVPPAPGGLLILGGN